jgi:beta-glucanase (GH16 family)
MAPSYPERRKLCPLIPELGSTRECYWQLLKRSNYTQGFHTYTLEWSENFIKIYVDLRLRNMVQRRINRKRQSNDGFFWKRRFFPLTVLNNSAQKIDVPNPWTTQR